ncbi:MAG: hypothetical protein V4584_09600 [Verrucomicrobiota bacterium]
MKILSILTSVIALGALHAHGQPAAPASSTAQVTLRASDKTVRPEKEKKKDGDKKDEKKDDKPKSETVTKTIDVSISAAQTINGPLKLVTCWYGRDVAAKQQVMVKKEESEVTLDAAKTAKVTIPSFAFVSTPAHSRKGADGKNEKVDAAGQTFSGWVIRAYEGTTLVGETASAAPFLKLHDE